ncbi:MAG: anhydro-N-acetylmuramic acid kinase, partial [Gallionella sp.]|nr:anhydro-N-acetylmuramic acid kinase [Gallionella sp.]
MGSKLMLSVTSRELFIGLMSGTSLDGVDAALVEFTAPIPTLIESTYLPFPAALRAELHALQAPAPNELDRAARAANELARLYAD